MKLVPILNAELKVPLSAQRRDLMHAVMDGQNDLDGTMYVLHHYKFCDQMLRWLIAHKYTGKNLEALLVKRFKSSVPALVGYIVDAINGRITDERRPGT